MPPLVTQHYDQLFNEMAKLAEKNGMPLSRVHELYPNGGGQLKKMAQTGINSNSSISRMAPSLWAPDLQISSMVLPQTVVEKNRWRRQYYAYDPVVGAAIDIHTRYPLSNFRLRCEDDVNGEISDYYEELSDELDLPRLLRWIGQEYHVCGECFPFGNWNESERTWDSFILINPDYVQVDTNPFSDKDVFISIGNWNKQLRRIVSNGPNDPRTGRVYQHMMNTARDVMECIRAGRPYYLSPAAVSQVARKVSYFDTRGTSIIDRIFKWLMYQDKLQAAQLAMADRHITPVEVWTVGETGNEADEASLQALEDVIRNTYNSPLKCIIWNHTLKGEMLGASGAAMPLAPEYDYINQQKMIGLMINDAVLTAAGPTYASASVAADVMASWYSNYRQELEEWTIKHVFLPVANSRGYHKASPREFHGHYRDKMQKRKPLLPKVIWDKPNLRDDYQKLQTIIGLAREGRAPWAIVYDMLNLDFKDVIKHIQEESKIFGKLAVGADPFGGGAAMDMVPDVAGLDSSDMGGDIMPVEQGGAPMMGGMPVDQFNAMPEGGAGSPGGMYWAPESAGAPPGAENLA